MTNLTRAEMDRVDFAQATSSGSAVNMFISDVQEARVYYPIYLVQSDTSGSANTVTVSKIDENDFTEPILPNVNLAGNGTLVLDPDGDVPPVPPREGGTNIEINSGSPSVEATLYYYPSEL